MYDKLINENVNNTVELFTLLLYFEKKKIPRAVNGKNR